MSVRTAARRLNISMDQVRRQEEPTNDMLISELLRWQQALEVPLAELLIDSDGPLSDPIRSRGRLLRIMKTVQSIRETDKASAIQHLAATLEEQLVELMPELKDVAAWPLVGQRRPLNDLGRIAECVIPDTFAHDSMQ